MLDISPANQRVLLHRARALSAGKLEEYFAGPSEQNPEKVCNVRRRSRHCTCMANRTSTDAPARTGTALRTRLLPLQLAVLLQGFMLWTPVEKLFMTEIGFDAAAVGVMAAAYAALVPIVEIPSGILADRWSRRGVLIVASLALALSALIGGLSTGVLSYIGSALVLGVYFAMYSGTMDADRLRHRARGDRRQRRFRAPHRPGPAAGEHFAGGQLPAGRLDRQHDEYRG